MSNQRFDRAKVSAREQRRTEFISSTAASTPAVISKASMPPCSTCWRFASVFCGNEARPDNARAQLPDATPATELRWQRSRNAASAASAKS